MSFLEPAKNELKLKASPKSSTTPSPSEAPEGAVGIAGCERPRAQHDGAEDKLVRLNARVTIAAPCTPADMFAIYVHRPYSRKRGKYIGYCEPEIVDPGHLLDAETQVRLLVNLWSACHSARHH